MKLSHDPREPDDYAMRDDEPLAPPDHPAAIAVARLLSNTLSLWCHADPRLAAARAAARAIRTRAWTIARRCCRTRCTMAAWQCFRAKAKA